MPLSLTRSRVGFHAKTTLVVDGDQQVGEEHDVARDSTEVDLRAWKLRALATPAGHKLGAITVTMRVHDDDDLVIAVPIPNLDDDDEAATTLLIDKDWPLMLTTFHVEHPRDDRFEIILVTEPR